MIGVGVAEAIDFEIDVDCAATKCEPVVVEVGGGENVARDGEGDGFTVGG